LQRQLLLEKANFLQTHCQPCEFLTVKVASDFKNYY
jgi:hypothetical protein